MEYGLLVETMIEEDGGSSSEGEALDLASPPQEDKAKTAKAIIEIVVVLFAIPMFSRQL